MDSETSPDGLLKPRPKGMLFGVLDKNSNTVVLLIVQVVIKIACNYNAMHCMPACAGVTERTKLCLLQHIQGPTESDCTLQGLEKGLMIMCACVVVGYVI